MKRLVFVLFLLVLVLSFGSSVALAAGPVGQVTPPVIPEDLTKLIEAVIGFLVILGLKDLSNLTGNDLNGYATAVTATVLAIVIFSGNRLIELAVQISPDWAPLIVGLFQIASILLAMFGVARLKRGAKWAREVKDITPKG